MDTQSIIAAVVGVVNAPITQRSPALVPLAYLKYPQRELRPQVNSDGTISVKLAKWGWEYKRRRTKPESPPPVDPTAVQEAFNSALPDGIIITAVQDYGTYIQIKMRGA